MVRCNLDLQIKEDNLPLSEKTLQELISNSSIKSLLDIKTSNLCGPVAKFSGELILQYEAIKGSKDSEVPYTNCDAKYLNAVINNWVALISTSSIQS